MSALDRTRPPTPTGPLPFRFPAFERLELLPGLDAYLAPVRRAPLLALELIAPGGGRFDPASAAGLGSFTAALLDEGTARRSAPELATAAERLGASLSTSADWDAAFLAAGGLAEHADSLLGLLAEVALLPSFPEAEVERLRRRRLAELMRRRSMPGPLAEDRLAAALYGEGIYGYPLLGREADLRGLARADAVAFYERHVRRGTSALVAAGDFDPAALATRARELLGAWPAQPPPAANEVSPRELDGVEVHLVDRPDAAQTELRLGHCGPPRNHPRRIPLMVLNTLLGGKFTSRINLSLRERHGYTYGASSRLPDRLGPGPFVVSAAVETAVAGRAVEEILGELRRLREELVSPQELEDTVRYLEGVFPYTVQTVQGVASRLAQLAVYGLPDDYYDRLQERLRAVTAEELRELAAEHLRPDRLAVVAVGPAAAVRPQLEPLGAIRGAE
jgi:zinc protease